MVPKGVDPRLWAKLSPMKQKLALASMGIRGADIDLDGNQLNGADVDAGGPPPAAPTPDAPPPQLSPEQQKTASRVYKEAMHMAEAPALVEKANADVTPVDMVEVPRGNSVELNDITKVPPGVTPSVYDSLPNDEKRRVWDRMGKQAAAPRPPEVPHEAYAGQESNPGIVNDVVGFVKNKFGPHAEYNENAGGIKKVEQPVVESNKPVPAPLDRAPVFAQRGESMPPQQHPVFVGAHEEHKVNPVREHALEQSIANEAEAVRAAGDIKANATNVLAGGQEDVAKQEMRDMDQLAENQKARQEYLDKIGGDIERDSHALSQAQVDPSRYWKNKGLFSQVLGVIAMALGGFAAPHTGGRNLAADMIERQIENDVAAQRSDLENKWSGLRMQHSLLADKTQRYGSIDLAEKQHVASGLQAAMLMAQAAAARATSPVERANAEALAQQLQQKAIMVGIEMNKYVAAGYVGGGGGMGNPNKPTDVKTEQLYNIGKDPNGKDRWVDTGGMVDTKDLNSRNQASDQVADISNQMQAILTGPDGWKAYVPGTDAYGQLRALSKSMAVEDVRNAAGNAGGRGLGMLQIYAGVQGNLDNPMYKNSVLKSLATLSKEAEETKLARMKQLEGHPIVRMQMYADPKTGQHKVGVFDAGSTYSGPEAAPAGMMKPPSGKAFGQ